MLNRQRRLTLTPPTAAPTATSLAYSNTHFLWRQTANTVVAVQIPLGGDTDFVAARERRMQRDALAAAEAHAARLAAQIAALKEQLKMKSDDAEATAAAVGGARQSPPSSY